MKSSWRKCRWKTVEKAVDLFIPHGHTFNGMCDLALAKMFGHQNLKHVMGQGWFHRVPPKGKAL